MWCRIRPSQAVFKSQISLLPGSKKSLVCGEAAARTGGRAGGGARRVPKTKIWPAASEGVRSGGVVVCRVFIVQPVVVAGGRNYRIEQMIC